MLEKLNNKIKEARKIKDKRQLAFLQTLKAKVDNLEKNSIYTDELFAKELQKNIKSFQDVIDTIADGDYKDSLKQDIKTIESILDDKFKVIQVNPDKLTQIVDKYNFSNIGEVMKAIKSNKITEFKNLNIDMKQVSKDLKEILK